MLLKFLIAATLTFLCLAGCKSNEAGKKLVGKWNSGTGSEQMIAEFSADGKLALNARAPTGPMWMTILGTYSLSGDTINFTYTDMRMTPDDPKQQAIANMALKATKQRMLDVFIKNDSSDQLSWKSDDQFVMTDAKGKPQTFDRVKK